MRDQMGSTAAAVLFALLSLALCFLCTLFASVQPYMDEPFHVPQTQRYCVGDFGHWDPKITTFPGLYLVAAAANAAMQRLGLWSEACTTQGLRFVNVCAAIVMLWLLLRMRRSLHAVTLFLFPISFFYYFLYYTDTCSTLSLVLLQYLSSSQSDSKHDGAPARSNWLRQIAFTVVAGASILFRQTNAVWVAFYIGVNVVQQLEQRQAINRDDKTVGAVTQFVKAAARHASTLLRLNVLTILPVVAFAAFVVVNKGITVGDKEHHQPVKHFAQIPYFFLFCASLLGVFGSQALLSPATIRSSFSTLWRWLTTSPISAALLVAAFAAWTSFLYHYSYPHPFLLADNRHYVFYLWQRFLHKDSVRLALAPVSFYCAFAVLHRLVNDRGLVWTLGYCCALFITLVPAALLEPRYFIPGVFVAHMNIAQPASSSVQSLLAFVAVNAVTVYVFLYRPFEWHDGSVARFLW